ncbi:MAG: large conductance mechanosensitive channel [Thermoproteota archaeon]|nr:large conductance mechanosensitive channel [Thermoproteota archaeon]
MSKDDQMIDELKKIRLLLEPKPAPPAPPKPKGMMNEFKDFLSQYKVMGMAVAFILGLYLGGVVQALVKDLVMPIIGLVVPGIGNLSTLTVTIMNQVFGIGDFLAAVITFIIVALVIFIIVKLTKRMGIE